MSLRDYIIDPGLRAQHEAQPGPAAWQPAYSEPAYQYQQPELHKDVQSMAIHELTNLFLGN